MSQVNDNLDLDLAVDQDAEPIDLDAALAKFLLNLVRSTPVPISPAAIVFTSSEIEKG